MDPKADAAPNHSTVQAGMAWRVKYRIDPENPKRRFSLRSLGVQYMNRGTPEVYPNGQDVRALGLTTIKVHFDYAEANHNGVAVEEIPPAVQAARDFCDPWSKKKYEGLGAYNLRMCDGAEYLCNIFTQDGARQIVAGTLSHSHLLLVLLCILTGAQWNVKDSEGNFTFPCDEKGYINTAAVRPMTQS